MICCLLWSNKQSKRMDFVISTILKKFSKVGPVFWIGSHGEGLDYSSFWHVTILSTAIFRTAAAAKGNRLRSPPTVCGPAQSENFWVINRQIYYLQKHYYVLRRFKLPLNQQMSFFKRAICITVAELWSSAAASMKRLYAYCINIKAQKKMELQKYGAWRWNLTVRLSSRC